MTSDREILVAVDAAAKAAWYAGRGRLDHDDCVSEANEAVALAMRTFDPSKGCSLSTYAANRARWQAMKLLGVAVKNRHLPLEWVDAPAARPAVSLKEMFRGIELDVLTLRSKHGYTYREIAAILGISYFRVFKTMQRVRRKLKDWSEES
jgi:DNA-directed RNA polymerase specialized sigma subunit